ncbi:MAG: response regulator [Bdellovibrionales bacterium]|nr:response regulator [Bdellovibrionales bacterium]
MALNTQEYLANKKILILDKSSTSRHLLELALMRLGVDKGSITSLKNFHHAVEFVRINKPEIIFTDFQIHDRFGLDLVSFQSEYCQDETKKIFVVVTENATDSAVVDAADEDVDGYILKPFTTEAISEKLIRIIESKTTPNHYKTMLSKARGLQQAGKTEDAIIHFEMAINLAAKPSLALYYLGEIYRLKRDYGKAISHFKQGQKIIPLHFRCLVAEFITQFEIEEYVSAYKLLEKISAHYPLSPKILKYAFALCIKSFRFSDVEKYYMHYLQLERKTEDIKTSVSTTLLEAGVSLLRNKKYDDALDYFLKGSVIIDKNSVYLHKVVDALLEHQVQKQAETFVSMFGPEEIGDKLYRQLLFKIKTHKMPYDSVIEMGKGIINEGIASPEIYATVFNLLKNTPHEALLKTLVTKAIQQFPNKKSQFISYMPEQ